MIPKHITCFCALHIGNALQTTTYQLRILSLAVQV